MDRLAGRDTAGAEDAQGTPTQSHISSRVLVFEDRLRTPTTLHKSTAWGHGTNPSTFADFCQPLQKAPAPPQEKCAPHESRPGRRLGLESLRAARRVRPSFCPVASPTARRVCPDALPFRADSSPFSSCTCWENVGRVSKEFAAFTRRAAQSAAFAPWSLSRFVCWSL